MRKSLGSPVLAAMIVLAFAVTLASGDSQAHAQTASFGFREKVLSVTGVATSDVPPDLLVMQFGVEIQKETAKDALESNSRLMNAVVDSIVANGMTEDEISTSRFSIYPVYEGYEENGRYKQEFVGYKVTNKVSVETSKLDSAARIIDDAVTAGANRVDSVDFALSPETHAQVKDGLLEQAILDARSKAQKALDPLDHKITGIKSVRLSESGLPEPYPVSFRESAAAGTAMFKDAASPIFSSDQQVQTAVQIVFLIGAN